jgi:hypothetical protein
MMEIKICFFHMKVHAYYHCLILNVRNSWTGGPIEQNVGARTTTYSHWSYWQWPLGHVSGELFQKNRSSRFAATPEICATSGERCIICKSHWCNLFSFVLRMRILYWWQSHGRWYGKSIGNSHQIVWCADFV